MNTKGVSMTFLLVEGRNCGTGYFGFCKNRWGAFSYTQTKVGTYAPSIVNQQICQHAGYVGDEIQWSISENGVKVAEGTTTLKTRNSVLINTAGAPEDLYHFDTQPTYNPVDADSVGVGVIDIMNEPPVCGGFTVPVKGWNGSEFDDATVQAAYVAYQAQAEPKDPTALQAAYLAVYYPDLPQL